MHTREEWKREATALAGTIMAMLKEGSEFSAADVLMAALVDFHLRKIARMAREDGSPTGEDLHDMAVEAAEEILRSEPDGADA